MGTDRIFAEPGRGDAPFEFNANVAAVFDDMIHRSVPLYREALAHQIRLARRFYRPGTVIFDLGCSNGNFGVGFLERMDETPFSMTAIDNSAPMLDIYARRLAARRDSKRVRLLESDILAVPLENASVIVMNLTLQFLPKEDRDRLVSKIHRALVPGGLFLLTEKVVHEDAMMTDLQQEFYYAFKAENGYSALEISQKREALENVLVPETVQEHARRLEASGFSKWDIYMKWHHFTSFLAVKDA